MFKLKELVHIILAVVLFAFVIWFFKDSNLIIPSFIIAGCVIFTNVFAKKIAGRYFHTDVELSVWEFQRWGYYKRSEFKKPKPIGLILPFLLVFFSVGFIKVLAFLQTQITPTIKRVVKKRGGLERYAELTEWHNSWIISIGILANVGLVLVPHLIFKNSIVVEVVKYSLYYAVWNMVPVSKLDGMKILSLGVGWWLFMWFWVIVGLGLLMIL